MVTPCTTQIAAADLGPISITMAYSPQHVQHVLTDPERIYTKSDIDKRAIGLLIGGWVERLGS